MVTNGSLSDRAYLEVKNEAWKASAADWVLMVDADEWVDVWPQDLASYEAANVTAVKTKAVYLVWDKDTMDLSEEPRGVWDVEDWDASKKIAPVHMYDKPALFYRSAITETRISPGGHAAFPTGRVKWLAETLKIPPRLYHARYYDVSTLVARFQKYRLRLSEENKRRGWGGHYSSTSALITDQFAYLRRCSRRLPWRVL
jgi:hypothetical protein